MKEVLQLEVCEVRAGYGRDVVLDHISFSVQPGEVLTLLGANGEGKTTLLKTLCGLLPPFSGRVLLNGKNIYRMSRKRLASYIAYVPQIHIPGLPLSVEDMVVLGRANTRGIFSQPNRTDFEHARHSLEVLGIADLADKPYTDLSGGEQRLVLIARALTQSAKFIILDEPVSNLDLGNQIKVLKVIHDLEKRGIGIVMSSHFPEHSLWLNARTAILQAGAVQALDQAKAVITSERLTELYGTEISVFHHENGSSHCEPKFIEELSL
jgi:iron complex transport system ATP-binding protein